MADKLPTYAFTANGIDLEVRAASMEHAKALIFACLSKSDVDYESFRLVGQGGDDGR